MKLPSLSKEITSSILDVLICILVLSYAAYFIYTTFYYFDCGLDVSDEGFHINSALNTNPKFVNLSHFGKYTGWLFGLCSYNLVVLRYLGLALLLILSCLFVYRLLRLLTAITTLHFSRQLSLSMYGIACIGVTMYYYRNWLPTPSYNWLNLLSILIVFIGLFLQMEKSMQQKTTSWSSAIMIGLGLMLCFLSKPTTSVGMIIMSGIMISLSGFNKVWLKTVLYVSLSTILFFVLHILIFEEGFMSFYDNIMQAIEDKKVTNKRHSINVAINSFRNDFFRVMGYLQRKIFFLTMVFIAATCQYLARRYSLKYQNILKFFLRSAIVVALIYIGYQLYDNPNLYKRKSFVLMTSRFSLLALVTALIYHVYDAIRFRHWMVVFILFFLVPFIYGFGSAAGTIVIGANAMFFFIMVCVAAALMIDADSRFKIAYYAIVMSVIFACDSRMLVERKHPYRIAGSLWKQTEEVTFPNTNTRIKVDPLFAIYITEVQRLALENGWQYGMNILDMTGATPLIAFILDGKPTGALWMSAGGHRGSDIVKFRIENENRNIIKKSWVLTAPDGRRAVSTRLLDNVGISFKRNYVKVAEFRLAARNETQILWRPK